MIHVAGQPDASGRQKCVRCGMKLPDVPGATWKPGSLVRHWKAPDGGDLHETVAGDGPTCPEPG